MNTLAAALAHARAHHAVQLERLMDWLRIPSISTDPAHAADVRSAAIWLCDHLRAIGMSDVALLETAGHPVVSGAWLGAGPHAPTLLIYGHYDVQPADPLEQWRTPPFSPTLLGETLFARGVSDDKGQVLALVAAVESWLAVGGPPCNIKLLIEGEEEIGSRNLAPLLSAERERFAADAVLIADQPMLAPNLPVIMIGVRGNCYLEVRVRGPASDLHSGTFGGAIENPLNVLTRLLATLQDAETRRVLVPGFYDAVGELAPAERELIARSPVNEALALGLSGAPALAGEAGYSLVERLGVRPTLEIHGIYGGYTGPGKKTIIPAEGTAKIGMRLVPSQDGPTIAALVEAHLRQHCPPTVTLDVQLLDSSPPALVDYRHPAVQAAAAAYQASFGAQPVYVRGGGSLPIVRDLQATLGAPAVLVGFGLPDDNLHAPNEKLYLPGFYRGSEMAIHYCAIFAAQGEPEVSGRP